MATKIEGLSDQEAERRLKAFGNNEVPQRGTDTFGSGQVIRNFTHLMALLLWFGGALAFLAQLPQLGVAIWAVNLLNGVFSAWQQERANHAVRALRKLLPITARVMRCGKEVAIAAEAVVPGDVIVIGEGDRVPADARIADSAGLRLDQSLLTGESAAVDKGAGDAILAGTFVTAGHGRAVVISTGAETQFGRVAALTENTEKQQSPLEREMSHATRTITVFAIAVGAVFLLASVVFARIDVRNALIYALGVIVAFVPEGLLPTLTVALALGAQRMAHRKALVKRLSAVETLGATTVICTDKTGTLTQNQMTVRRVWAGGDWFRTTGIGYAPQGCVHGASGITPSLERLVTIGVCCNNTRLIPPKDTDGTWSVAGDATEAALLVLARKAGFDPGVLVDAYPRIAEIPFNSGRRRMTTVHSHRGQTVIFMKGAIEELLPRCTKVSDSIGTTGLTAARSATLRAAELQLAGEGLRVLGFAVGSALPGSDPDQYEQALEFVGMVAMDDPSRPEVPGAIATCHAAGVRVVMMTGDNEHTARSVAHQIGLVTDQEPRLISGEELERLTNDELATAIVNPVLFARVRPEQKLRVVEALQQQGHVVAVTGDGVNDAPALKRADIGVAMGASGSDVAREAADLVLLDDSFGSIVNAIEEGRAVFSNVRKFTTYVFTSNAPEAVPFIAFALSGGRIPPALDVMRILAVDLGTDVMPAMALGTEPPQQGLMTQKPRARNQHLIDKALLIRSYLWLGIPQSVAVMTAFYFPYWRHGYSGQWLDLPGDGWIYSLAASTSLATVVATQIGNLFAQRSGYPSGRRFFPNRFIVAGIVSEVLLFIAFTTVPPLQRALGTAPMDLAGWLFAACCIPLLVVADNIRKLGGRRKGLTVQSTDARPTD